MADDLTTVLRFVGDANSAQAAINGLTASLQKLAAQSASLFAPLISSRNQAASAINQAAASADRAAKSTKSAADNTLAFAQASARLQVAQGNAAGAAETLKTALAGVDRNTTAAVRAQTQLVSIEAQLANAAGKAETAMLREAQATARLQQIAGNTPAAIKTLSDALEKASNKASLPALRAELQKTYLDTNYANSPLIGAIDRINAGLQRFSPLLGSAGAGLQKVIGFAGQAAQSLSNTGAAVEINAKSASAFFERIKAINQAIVNFGKEEGGTATLSLGLSRVFDMLARAGDAIKAKFAQIRESISQAFSRAPHSATLGLDKVAGEAKAATTALPNVAASANAAAQAVESLGAASGGAKVAMTGVVAVLGAVIISVAALTAATIGAVAGLKAIGAAGIRANSQLEQTKIGIASVIASVGELNRGGIKLEGVDALNAALPLAQKQLERLRVDALQTALTFEQIAPAFLQAIGPGLRAGLNLDQIRKTVIDISQLIVPLTGNAAQLGQELRAILSGDINQDTQVAKALNITRQEIEAAKEAGTLADLLNKKLAAAAATGRLMANTFEAATSNLREAGAVLAAAVTKGLFDELKNRINKTLPQIFETASGSVRIAPEFAGIANTLTEIFDTAGAAAADAITVILDGVKNISAFLTANQEQVNQIINAVGTAARITGSIFVTVFGAIAGATAQLVLFGAKIAPVIAGLTTMITLLLAVGPGATGLATTLALLSRGFTALVASLSAARAALISTSTFLLTTPAGWAILAASVAAAGLAYVAFGEQQEDAAKKSAKIRIDDIGSQLERVEALRKQLTEAQGLTGAQSRLNAEQSKFAELLGTLPPKQRAVIEALADQKDKVEALKKAVQGNTQEAENAAKAQQIILSAGIAARQQEIDQIQQRIKLLDEELRKRKELLEAGTRQRVVTTVDAEGGSIPQLENTAEAEAKLAAERNASNETLKERQKLQQEDIDKLNLTAKTLNQTEDALLKARQAGGLTTEQFNALKTALDNARASGRGIGQAIDDISAALGGAKTKAEQARLALEDFFASGDTGGLRKRVSDTINRIAADIVKAGGSAKDALGAFDKAIKENKDGIADTVKTLTAAEKVTKALQDRINPPSRGGGARRAAAESRAEASAELKLLQQIEKEHELAARRESERLKRSLEDRLIDIADYTTRAIAIDQSLLQARLATIQEEENAAVRTTKTKAEAEAKRAEFRLKANQAILDSELRQEDLRRQRREAERRAEEEHAQAIRDIRETTRRSEENAIRDAIGRGQIGALAGEQRLIELERERFEERKRRLQDEFITEGRTLQQRQKINDELAKLAAERAAFELDASARIQEAQQKEAENFREFVKARIDALIDLKKAELDAAAARTALALLRRRITPEQAEQAESRRRVALLEIEHEERKRQIEAEIEALRKRAAAAGALALAEVDIEKNKNALLEAEQRRFNAAIAAEEERARQAKSLADSSSDASIFGREFDAGEGLFGKLGETAADALGKVSDSLGNMQTIAEGAFGSLASGLANAIEAFILTGNIGPAALKKLAAGVIASVVAQAAVKAIFELAEGFAALARHDPLSASQHFAAAKTFGIVAGVAAAAGAALGAVGGGATGAAISGGGFNGGQGVSTGTREINQSTPIPQQPQVIRIVLRAETEEGVIVRRVEDDFRNNGRLREMIRRDVVE